jgi:RNA polymerase sigma-70 factor (ECF subfamily)
VNVAFAAPLLAGLPTVADADPDIALVDRVRGGDDRAFDELVRRYQRPLYYLALRYVRNDADAADVTQRAFVRAFRSLARFRGDASLRTWLYRIAINLALNHIRDRRRERAADIDDAALATDAVGADALERARRAQRLRAAIEQLPPKQRMVIELRIYDELPFKDVGELAGCSENAAKVNFHHGMRRLRQLMTGDAR